MDLFGQMFIVDQGLALGRFITHYRAQYFYSAGFGGFDYQLRRGTAEEIYDRIRPTVMRLASQDHLDMPELIHNDIFIDLPPEAMKIYKDFEDHFLAEIGDEAVMSVNAAAVGNKCRQVVNGGVYNEAHFAHQIHEAKTLAIVDLVEQLQGNALFVAYEFQHDLDRLQRAFPNAPSLTGMVGKKLDETLDAFNRGDIPVLLAHPLSAGHGLNLQDSCYNVCFYGLGWDLDSYKQFIARVWRQGQASDRVMVHRILASKTLDVTVARILKNKDAAQNLLLNAIRSDLCTA
jgi:SNF2 family DNA or RNA helicase